MGDNWDEDDYEPQLLKASVVSAVNKFDGEDAEDEVKDCWDDEDEEEKKDEEKVEAKSTIAPPPKSKAKKLAEKLAEKERAALLENDDDILDGVGLTKEEIELRRRRAQEESDLKVAMETFGVTESSGTLDGFNPTTKEQFDEFQTLLVDKLSSFRDNEQFPDFVSSLVKNLCLHLNSTTLKSLRTQIESLCSEKQKLEKSDKSKKPGKGKGKAKLTMESNISHMTRYGYENDMDNDYDDFI